MPIKTDYHSRFASFVNQTYFPKLEQNTQIFIRDFAFEYRFSFQEFRQTVEAARDLLMWQEGDLQSWWQQEILTTANVGQPSKKLFFQHLNTHLNQLKSTPKTYPANGLAKPQNRDKLKVISETSDKKIFGMCPVASEETVCCNLRTIDAVENCAFGCSYCTIQTFYSDTFKFDADFATKLTTISLEPNRFYHFGTGQSSDSLVWGNKNGTLAALCQFAKDAPNVLLEFKTKSNNIRYLLENEIPPNIVCSWSLNTPTIIKNEEHFTADLEQRIEAARLVADKGIKVSFHFHPMVYYQNWQKDYLRITQRLLSGFDPAEVLFISFGSITMIKPAIKKIRALGNPTKILQMEMVPDPHGKLTYPDDIKVAMFSTMYDAFKPWHREVFFYLCMEKAAIWRKTFGFVYNNNEDFEKDFGKRTMCKITNNLAR